MMMCWMTLEWSAEKTEVWFREAVSWFEFRNLDCKYDVVVGPVADDTVGLLIRQFSRGNDRCGISEKRIRLRDADESIYVPYGKSIEITGEGCRKYKKEWRDCSVQLQHCK